MNLIINDERFAALFKESIASDYKDALMFMNVNPDISLMKFRKVLESLCLRYAARYDYTFKGANLSERITELSKQQFICGVNKESFHEVRDLTNTGVHIKKISKEELISNAVSSRKGVLNLLEHAFLDLGMGNEIPKYEMTFAGGQEQKNLWYSCLSSFDYNDHFRLGRVYQELAEGYERLALDNTYFISWSDSNFVFAAECYKRAFQFCSGKHVDSIIQTKGKGISISSESYESLFCYALLCLKGKIGNKGKTDAQIMLHALVNRGYRDAYAYLGWSYYLDKDYKKAHKYLTHNKINLNIFTYHKLGVLYSEGKASSINIDAAIDNFHKAAELGCSKSMLELGKLYHQGEVVDKNDLLAQTYLQKSIIGGNKDAIVYLDDNYLKIKEIILKAAEQISGALDKEIHQVKQVPYIAAIKIGRNDRCPCGSGSKYKNCCGRNKVSSTRLL